MEADTGSVLRLERTVAQLGNTIRALIVVIFLCFAVLAWTTGTTRYTYRADSGALWRTDNVTGQVRVYSARGWVDVDRRYDP